MPGHEPARADHVAVELGAVGRGEGEDVAHQVGERAGAVVVLLLVVVRRRVHGERIDQQLQDDVRGQQPEQQHLGARHPRRHPVHQLARPHSSSQRLVARGSLHTSGASGRAAATGRSSTNVPRTRVSSSMPGSCSTITRTTSARPAPGCRSTASYGAGRCEATKPTSVKSSTIAVERLGLVDLVVLTGQDPAQLAVDLDVSVAADLVGEAQRRRRRAAGSSRWRARRPEGPGR